MTVVEETATRLRLEDSANTAGLLLFSLAIVAVWSLFYLVKERRRPLVEQTSRLLTVGLCALGVLPVLHFAWRPLSVTFDRTAGTARLEQVTALGVVVREATLPLSGLRCDAEHILDNGLGARSHVLLTSGQRVEAITDVSKQVADEEALARRIRAFLQKS